MEMSLIALAAITLVYVIFLLKFLTIKKNRGYRNLPNGSLGLPLIGETLSFLHAHKKEQGAEWIDKRVAKYGPVFKTSLLGSPVVFIMGIAGNKFILGSGEDVFATTRPKRISDLQGENNIFELSGSRYRLIKRAMLSFLKPESLQNYVKRMDDLVTASLLREIKEKGSTIKTVSFMKKLTFNVACDILFGIHDEATKEAFLDDFHILFNALGSFPVKFPGSAYSKGLQARARICDRLLPILRKRREALAAGAMCPTDDVVSCLLALKDENEEPVSEGMVVDNFTILIIASHDTTAVLLSLMVWKLSNDKQIYSEVLKEQMDILRDREAGTEGKLTWVDIQKMKFTWQVAQELMRMIPPVFGTFRKALIDTSFGGYDIPKGWQVFSVTHATHMEKDIFSSPTEFDPSRFNKSAKPLPPYAYIPFGAGLHSCIGNEFARIEALTTIHNLVTKFEWSQVHPDETITRRAMPYPSMGLPIKIRPRVTT
ncbi:taxadiene 5-alpha hydroxylase-like [Rhododendron vialii]|uniref:taxadiene 5-alpha hydroxylase-like n=1 Tax=Rhododendron vialii TaxID=182163 RepID=UPI00265FD14C|nr:taxadiene 5-alpha hydroxylase-like [Rhododendron vialii]